MVITIHDRVAIIQIQFQTLQTQSHRPCLLHFIVLKQEGSSDWTQTILFRQSLSIVHSFSLERCVIFSSVAHRHFPSKQITSPVHISFSRQSTFLVHPIASPIEMHVYKYSFYRKIYISFSLSRTDAHLFTLTEVRTK